MPRANNVYHCFGGNASHSAGLGREHMGRSLPHTVQLLHDDAPLATTDQVGVTLSCISPLAYLAVV